MEFICPALPLEGLLLLLVPFIITSLLSSRVTLLTMTAMNVDILLALFLGLRYKQVVTVRRVRTLVVTLWVFSISVAVMIFYTPHVAVSIACAVFFILHNNLSFLLHQDLRQNSSLSSTKTRPRSPMSTKWRRNLTE